ncbi:MAG: 3-5 exoribonuclease [Bryobacterales bacterium]|nr:3-5 exoribonuclease [Bryobacterales bacterium]
MKSPLVRELKPNEVCTAVLLVHSKEIRQKRTGEPYLSMTLSDRSGELDAKMWDNVAEVMDTFERDDFVKVKGLLQLYNNRPQFTIHKLRPVQDHEVDFADFFPASARDCEEMWSELRGLVCSLTNSHLRALLDAFLDDPDIAARYKIAPAAKTIHHAFRSGLLEHVISLCGLAKLVGPHYPCVDLNLLLTGAILHDIGKIHELTYERGFGYSTEGQLIGHISIAMRMMSDKLRNLPDFPVELRNLVEHMILSHHGLLEYGSPKVPVFPEALLLHHLDDMDSKMENMRALIAKEPQAQGLFTGYSQSLERVALRKERYLNPEQPPAAPLLPALVAASSDSVAASAVAAQPKPKPAPLAESLFGEKLTLALNFDRK